MWGLTVYCLDCFITVRAITDNGPGLQGNSGKRGLGFSLTKERLERLYDVKQQLELHDVPEGGLKVTLQIPLNRVGTEQALR